MLSYNTVNICLFMLFSSFSTGVPLQVYREATRVGHLDWICTPCSERADRFADADADADVLDVAVAGVLIILYYIVYIDVLSCIY